MVFCSIDVGVRGKVPFVVVCYRAVLKHECREGTKGTNWVQNGKAVVSLRCCSTGRGRFSPPRRKGRKGFIRFLSVLRAFAVKFISPLMGTL